MSLRKLKNPTPTADVQVSDGESFAVRGLSPGDTLGLYYRHTGQLSGLFERLVASYQSNGNMIEPADVQAVAFSLLNDAPRIMAEIIALAAGGDIDAEEDWDEDLAIATRLPFPVQADALSKIADLTFTTDMPVGKFLALVAGAINKATEKTKGFPTA